jgi:hypothetical protein
MRGLAPPIVIQTLWLFATVGCGSRGLVTFTIDPPRNQPLNPITTRVTQFQLTRPDGSVLGAVAPADSDRIPLGPLTQQTTPIDLVFTASSGAQLVGMARLKDVVFENGVAHDYPVEVRKPLLTVGAVLPPESGVGSLLIGGQIIDPNSGEDLTHPKIKDPALAPPMMPQGTSAAAATWSGKFILAGAAKALTVIDTGSGATVGSVPLSFTPVSVAVGARDSAIAVLDPSKNLLLYPDVGLLTSSPTSAAPMVLPMPDAPRAVRFSADGQRIYILTGGSAPDPCNDSAAPPANEILIAGIDGSTPGKWTLPSFASDLAVDSASGRVLVSMSTANEVGWIDPSQQFGTVTPQKQVAATCPTALRVANDSVFVITAARPQNATGMDNSFVLMRVPVMTNGSDAEPISFAGPFFDEDVIDMPAGDMNTGFSLKIRPRAISAYEMAISPDGGHAVFAVRARYHETMSDTFKLLMETCEPQNLDIIEYGLYTVDTAAGTAAYVSRSQFVVTPANPSDYCIICSLPPPIGQDLVFRCVSTPGDSAAGLSAVFGGT